MITRNGKPAAVLFGSEGEDWKEGRRPADERVILEMIEKRLDEATTSLDEMKARIAKPGRKRRRWRPHHNP